jgi:hypothetical protein
MHRADCTRPDECAADQDDDANPEDQAFAWMVHSDIGAITATVHLLQQFAQERFFGKAELAIVDTYSYFTSLGIS